MFTIHICIRIKGNYIDGNKLFKENILNFNIKAYKTELNNHYEVKLTIKISSFQ